MLCKIIQISTDFEAIIRHNQKSVYFLYTGMVLPLVYVWENWRNSQNTHSTHSISAQANGPKFDIQTSQILKDSMTFKWKNKLFFPHEDYR